MKNMIKFYLKNNLLTNVEIKSIQKLYELDENKLLEKYNDSFINLLKRTTSKSIFYKNYYKENGIRIKDIKTIEDISKLPIIKRSDIVNNADRIYTGFDFFRTKGLTSGTSGSPAMVYRTPISIYKEQAYLRNYRSKFGYNFKDKLLSLRGMLGKNVPYQFDNRNNILYISGPNINENTIQFYYDLIMNFNALTIEAFPSYLYKFFLELSKANLKVSVSNIFTSSEMLYEFQRIKMECFFNSSIHDWYGNVERSICIAQDINNKYYPMPLYSINEYRSNSIITTSLINYNFPLIRYEVDDRIKVAEEDFLKNLISPNILKIEGRSGDTLELKDGSIVGCIDHAFKGIDNLVMAQIYQSIKDKSIEVKLVVKNTFNQMNERQLKENIIRMIGNEIPIRFTTCNENDLVYNKSKKYQLIIKND